MSCGRKNYNLIRELIENVKNITQTSKFTHVISTGYIERRTIPLIGNSEIVVSLKFAAVI